MHSHALTTAALITSTLLTLTAALPPKVSTTAGGPAHPPTPSATTAIPPGSTINAKGQLVEALKPHYYTRPDLPYPGAFTNATCPVTTNLFAFATFAPPANTTLPAQADEVVDEVLSEAYFARTNSSSKTGCTVIGQLAFRDLQISGPTPGANVRSTYPVNLTAGCTYTLTLRTNTNISSVELNLAGVDATPSMAKPDSVNGTLAHHATAAATGIWTVTFEDAPTPQDPGAKDAKPAKRDDAPPPLIGKGKGLVTPTPASAAGARPTPSPITPAESLAIEEAENDVRKAPPGGVVGYAVLFETCAN